MLPLKLTDVAKINMGQSPSSETYNFEKNGLPFYQGNVDFGEKYPTARIWCDKPTKIAEPGDVLMSVRAPIGALNYANEKCCIGRGLAAITPNPDMTSSEFIYWFLRAKHSELNRVGTGSTFKAINRKTLESIELPKYNKNEQYYIAEILSKIDKTISEKKAQIDKLNDLIKARFVEMFGLPGTDPFGYGKVKLGECCEINPKKTKNTRLADGMEVSFVPMSSVSEKGEIDPSDIRKYEAVKKGFTYFAENDVLFAKITPCMENGKGAIAKGLMNGIGFGSTEFHVLRSTHGLSNPYWIYTITSFKTFRKNAESNMTGSAGQRRTPASFLEGYEISLPSIELQNQFANFVAQVDKSKFAVQKSLEKTQLLFDSLMQEYFR